MRKGEWYIDGIEVKISDRPHSICCACNCVIDLIKELRTEIAELKAERQPQPHDWMGG